MTKLLIGTCLACFIFLISCTKSNVVSETAGAIDFGKLKSVGVTELTSTCSYVALESSKNSLLGNISQIEACGDYIYILDNKTNTFNVFNKDGGFVMRLEGVGDGYGEFISPHSFWIDKRGYVLILDRQLNRLLKYRLANLEFVSDVTLPAPSPLSFAGIPNQETYIYYYPLRQKDVFSGKQFVVADGNGTVIRTFYDAPPAGKILHGNPANFYLFDGSIRTYPHFSNQVYELRDSSFNDCYDFIWGNLEFPPSELFQKYDNSGEIMRRILTGNDDWIRMLYVYETAQTLSIKYYIKKDLYLSIWDKKTNKVVNVKGDMIVDDLGIGGSFPLPIAVCDDLFVGVIYPFNVDKDKVKDKRLKELLDSRTEEDNPILAFYSFDSLHSVQ